MNGLTYEGAVVNGHILLPDHVLLPENARVLVTVLPAADDSPRRILSPRLAHAEQAADFQLTVEEAPDARV